jgi:hypothetical protein
MTPDVIASRQFSVGPGGYFMPGPGHGAVTISLSFSRPVPLVDRDPGGYPAWQCAYEIRYGDTVIRASCAAGMDGPAALLAAMRSAADDIDHRYFSAIDGVPEYLDAVPKEYLADMRGT